MSNTNELLRILGEQAKEDRSTREMVAELQQQVERLTDLVERSVSGAPKLMNTDEAAQYLHISKDWLYTLASKKDIPYYKVGKGLRFDRDELDRWQRKNRTKTKRELASEATRRTLTHSNS